MKIKPVSLQEKFNSFSDFWNPKIVGELNEQHVKIAKFKDEFISHQHDHEDELFLVIEGQITMEIENETHEINAGEFIIVPRGTPHKPSAVGEAKVLMFEPKSNLNTGNTENELTVKKLDKI